MSRWKYIISPNKRKDNKIINIRLADAREGKLRQLTKIYLEVTTKCGGECKHCYFSEHKNKSELSSEEIYEMLAFLENNGVLGITYAGGDALYRKDKADILKYGKDIGLKQTFCTRGLIKDLDSLKEVVSVKPDHIQFSTDPYISNYTLLEEIARIKEIGKIVKNTNIYISWVITFCKGSENYLKPLLDAVMENSGDEFRIHRVLPYGKMTQYPNMIPNNKEFYSAIKMFTYYFFDNCTNGHLAVEDCSANYHKIIPKILLKSTSLVGCPVGHTALTIIL